MQPSAETNQHTEAIATSELEPSPDVHVESKRNISRASNILKMAFRPEEWTDLMDPVRFNINKQRKIIDAYARGSGPKPLTAVVKLDYYSELSGCDWDERSTSKVLRKLQHAQIEGKIKEVLDLVGEARPVIQPLEHVSEFEKRMIEWKGNAAFLVMLLAGAVWHQQVDELHDAGQEGDAVQMQIYNEQQDLLQQSREMYGMQDKADTEAAFARKNAAETKFDIDKFAAQVRRHNPEASVQVDVANATREATANTTADATTEMPNEEAGPLGVKWAKTKEQKSPKMGIEPEARGTPDKELAVPLRWSSEADAAAPGNSLAGGNASYMSANSIVANAVDSPGDDRSSATPGEEEGLEEKPTYFEDPNGRGHHRGKGGLFVRSDGTQSTKKTRKAAARKSKSSGKKPVRKSTPAMSEDSSVIEAVSQSAAQPKRKLISAEHETMMDDDGKASKRRRSSVAGIGNSENGSEKSGSGLFVSADEKEQGADQQITPEPIGSPTSVEAVAGTEGSEDDAGEQRPPPSSSDFLRAIERSSGGGRFGD